MCAIIVHCKALLRCFCQKFCDSRISISTVRNCIKNIVQNNYNKKYYSFRLCTFVSVGVSINLLFSIFFKAIISAPVMWKYKIFNIKATNYKIFHLFDFWAFISQNGSVILLYFLFLELHISLHLPNGNTRNLLHKLFTTWM